MNLPATRRLREATEVFDNGSSAGILRPKAALRNRHWHQWRRRGAVLSQVQDGDERVIGYYSKTHTQPKKNYCVTRRELLAIVKGVKHFWPYLYGQHFDLNTDHASLM